MNHLTDIRDKLALERTRLANERTLLAYMRTGLSLLAAAAVLFQFFAPLNVYIIVVWGLIIAGLMTLIVGIYRFNAVRKNLSTDKH